jgi:hypothetical protein
MRVNDDAGRALYLYCSRGNETLKSKIHRFHQDEEQHWVADLECGHTQHVRHNPPLNVRPWVITPEGRSERIGVELECKKCDAGEPPDDF